VQRHLQSSKFGGILIKAHELEKSSLLLFVLMMVANVCNYLFQLVMGRMMIPSDYGTLNTLLSVFTVFSVSSNLFSSVTAQETAYYHTLGHDDHVRLVTGKLLRLAIGLSLAILVIGTALSPWIASLLQIKDSLLVSLTMLLVALGGISPLFSGILQGFKRFTAFSFAGILSALPKLVFGILFVWLGWRTYGVLAALFVASVATLLFCLYQCRDFHFTKVDKRLQPHFERRPFYGYFISVMIVQLLNALIANGDMLLVAAFSPTTNDTGIYASGMVIGKIGMYAATAVVTALFPLTAEASARNDDPRPLFCKAILYGGGIVLLYSLGLNLFGRSIIRIMFGESYMGVIPYLMPITLFVTASTLLIIEMNYLIALKRTACYTASVGVSCLFIVILVERFQPSVADMLLWMAVVLFVAFSINLVTILRNHQSVGA